MKNIIVYYKIGVSKQLIIEPIFYQCRKCDNPVIIQNVLHSLGFVANWYVIKEEEKEKK